MDIRERWQVEREHHDRAFRHKRLRQSFVPEEFYRTRPYGMRKLLDKAGPVSGLRILDVGCGLGYFSLYFASYGATVYALDIAMEALHSFDAPRSVIKLLTPGEVLPLQDTSIDVVWGAAVLHHLDIPLAAQEFYRVLRPGGRCFFYEPLGYNPFLRLWRCLTPYRRTPTERPLSLSDLEPLRRAFGQNVSIEFYHLLALFPQAIATAVGLMGLPGKRLYRRIQWLESVLARVDYCLFQALPVLRRYSQVMVITCTKPRMM
jgi:SAM-dependent methyltransferase